MSVCRAGGPESVKLDYQFVRMWPYVGRVEKLGKGLGQPVEGWSQLLGYSLCGQLMFDLVV